MKALLIVILLNSVIAACGSKEAQREKLKSTEKYINEKSNAANYVLEQKTPEPTPTIPEEKYIITTVDMSIKNPVYVSNNIGSWGYVRNNAPSGKRLATRGEILILLDTGSLKDLNYSTSAVWTESEINDDTVWVLNTYDGTLSETSKGNALSAIYVDR